MGHSRSLSFVEKTMLGFYMQLPALKWLIMDKGETSHPIHGLRQPMLILSIDMENGLDLIMSLFTSIMFMEEERLERVNMQLLLLYGNNALRKIKSCQ